MQSIAVWLPRLLFVVVPVFALLVALLYRRGGRHLIEHTVLVVHVQSAWFVLLSVDAIARWTLRLADGAPALELPLFVLSVAANLAVPVYLWMALRRFYGYGRWSTTWRFLLLLFGYGVLLLGALLFSLRMADW